MAKASEYLTVYLRPGEDDELSRVLHYMKAERHADSRGGAIRRLAYSSKLFKTMVRMMSKEREETSPGKGDD